MNCSFRTDYGIMKMGRHTINNTFSSCKPVKFLCWHKTSLVQPTQYNIKAKIEKYFSRKFPFLKFLAKKICCQVHTKLRYIIYSVRTENKNLDKYE